MNLIINIPEEDYNFVKRQVKDGITNPLKICIANGNPLDTVLAELRSDIESMDFDFGDYYDHTDEIIEMVCKVIDKYKEKVRDK